MSTILLINVSPPGLHDWAALLKEITAYVGALSLCHGDVSKRIFGHLMRHSLIAHPSATGCAQAMMAKHPAQRGAQKPLAQVLSSPGRSMV